MHWKSRDPGIEAELARDDEQVTGADEAYIVGDRGGRRGEFNAKFTEILIC
jgi:hypothetical protein